MPNLNPYAAPPNELDSGKTAASHTNSASRRLLNFAGIAGTIVGSLSALLSAASYNGQGIATWTVIAFVSGLVMFGVGIILIRNLSAPTEPPDTAER
ncbi:hypothetical protein [Rhodopirellula sp. MGV]|uniref:hypothetical protein n=1 Tax=Rhodopirellula sp. MGV TaxID=2023130 RepID=UPI000B96EDF8|nr:hypothetical protein [Rhodopirellula sp. MGV]PNY35055.1 hypothetical protein C2E31_20315 [Rhodopirellula baltica]PNY36796.1 hypothetical protein C2E31_11125 [Rhodopirellula baltica]